MIDEEAISFTNFEEIDKEDDIFEDEGIHFNPEVPEVPDSYDPNSWADIRNCGVKNDPNDSDNCDSLNNCDNILEDCEILGNRDILDNCDNA